MNKQYIDFNDIDVDEVIDFEFIDEKGRDSVENTLNTAQETKAKYTRKTIYINKEYADVLPFFDQKNSSIELCKLIRTAMKKERGEVTEEEMSDMMKMIREIHSSMTK